MHNIHTTSNTCTRKNGHTTCLNTNIPPLSPQPTIMVTFCIETDGAPTVAPPAPKPAPPTPVQKTQGAPVATKIKPKAKQMTAGGFVAGSQLAQMRAKLLAMPEMPEGLSDDEDDTIVTKPNSSSAQASGKLSLPKPKNTSGKRISAPSVVTTSIATATKKPKTAQQQLIPHAVAAKKRATAQPTATSGAESEDEEYEYTAAQAQAQVQESTSTSATYAQPMGAPRMMPMRSAAPRITPVTSAGPVKRSFGYGKKAQLELYDASVSVDQEAAQNRADDEVGGVALADSQEQQRPAKVDMERVAAEMGIDPSILAQDRELAMALAGDAKTLVDVRDADRRQTFDEWRETHETAVESGELTHEQQDVPGGISRRKHQITYLTQQAKAREMQLKNMWAANAQARRAAKQRYGF
eukprot:m.193350 g.193350  ORF g.193350 m.193350 type:complete len:410 (-) comp14879_c0_seq2:3278-4507(-)